MKQHLESDRLSPTQLRLSTGIDSAISRFLELFESDDMRLKATRILADMVVARLGPEGGKTNDI